MRKTKMAEATDILLRQMKRIEKLSEEDTPVSRKQLKEAIDTSKTLNGSAASIIKEAAVTLSMTQWANKAHLSVDNLVDAMGLTYDKE